jgi:hypothetical protein
MTALRNHAARCLTHSMREQVGLRVGYTSAESHVVWCTGGWMYHACLVTGLYVLATCLHRVSSHATTLHHTTSTSAGHPTRQDCLCDGTWHGRVPGEGRGQGRGEGHTMVVWCCHGRMLLYR